MTYINFKFNRTCYNVFKQRNFAPGWEPPDSLNENFKFAETPSKERDHKHGSVQHSVSESVGPDWPVASTKNHKA